jgi:hypothetical protein
VSNCFLYLSVTQKVAFDTLEIMCQAFIHVYLAQPTSCVVMQNSVLNVECKQENCDNLNV